MKKHNFAQRLKCIINEVCEVVKTETKIAQKFAKYYEQISFLRTMLAKQKQELSKYREEVEKLKRDNCKLEKIKQREEDRLCDIFQKVERMQIEYEQTLEQQIKQRRTSLMQNDCIRNIKLATQTYININALPQLIKGVTISEKESSSQWKPFCINPLKHTQKEAQAMIWDDSEIDSDHKKNWETFMGCSSFTSSN